MADITKCADGKNKCPFNNNCKRIVCIDNYYQSYSNFYEIYFDNTNNTCAQFIPIREYRNINSK